MNKKFLTKILITLLMTSIGLYLGTFFVVDDVYATTYEKHNSYNGHDLGFESLDTTHINFESKFEPFSTIINDITLIDDQKTYVIESANDLYMFSHLLNSSDYESYRSLNYVLGNHINYYDLLITDSSKTFEPIGFRYPFLGTFDGQGFEITNLYLEPILDSTVYEQKYSGLVYIAMFSHIGTSGVVKNFGLINPIIIQPIEWGVMSHIASIAGLNEGLIEHVYYIDKREHQAGFHGEGAFNISGLVSRNRGTFRESFIATPHVKSLAVVKNLGTFALLGDNHGIVEHIYYDKSLLNDAQTNTINAIGLLTTEFQYKNNFDQAWYFNDAYQDVSTDMNLKAQLMLKNTYPVLQGLNIVNNELEIQDATDLLYMNKLFTLSNVFRSSNYKIIKDIDMGQVSHNAYKQAAFGFSGTLRSTIVSSESILYQRVEEQFGTTSYHSIIGLNINYGFEIGRYVTYGLFSSLFGRVEHINFINATINPLDTNKQNDQREVVIGLIAGVMDEASINDVHIDLNVNIADFTQDFEKISMGSFVGHANGEITHVSSVGSMSVQTQSASLNQVTNFGGILGEALDIDLSKVINNVELHGFSYAEDLNQKGYIGSILGYGSINKASELVNKGNIYPLKAGKMNQLFIGGIFGYINEIDKGITQIYQNADIILDMNQRHNLNVNGIGYIKNDDINTYITSITHHGHVEFTHNSNLSQNDLALSSLNLSLGITLEGTATLNGLYQTQNQYLDLSYINNFSGILTKTNDMVLTLTKAYQKGNISFNTTNALTKAEVNISGVVLGKHYSLEHIRQEGNIDIVVSNNSNLALQGNLRVFGLFDTLSQNQTAINGYNQGNITVSKDEFIDVSYDLFISGIAHKHENTNYYLEKNINYQSIEIKQINGSMNNMLNAGDIHVSGDFNGNVKTSGIVLYNYGLLTNAINLGSINIINDIVVANLEIEAAGIVYLMVGKYASIKDAANNGDIKVISNTAAGFSHASGLVLRNDRLENNVDVNPTDQHQFAKIMFSANYGDVYAFNDNDESAYTILNETRSKASGILAIGLLSSINNVNFGNIYANHLASAMIGFIYLNKFGTINYDQVFIANSINYGIVREIMSYDQQDQSFVIHKDIAPTKLSNNAFGAIVGKIHTHTSTWAFAGDVLYPIDRIYFGYLLNFDSKIDMFSKAPPLSSSWQDVFGGDANAANLAIMEMQKYMATTNPDDKSAAPFAYFYAGGFFGQYLGKKISYYDLSETESGLFYEDFAFRSNRPIYKGTDQYILDYITYIPRDKINSDMLNRLETNQNTTFTGMYALSSSKGIGNGIFIPDNFDTKPLNEFSPTHPLGDASFLGAPETPGSISNQLYVRMRQIKMDVATTIYDLEIKQTDINGNPITNGLILKDPIIDEQRSLITYYIPSNATILAHQTSTIMNVNSFVEVSPGVANARKVLDIPGANQESYTWVGTHKKAGTQMVEIGPYHNNGRYDLTSNFNNVDSTTRNNPVYTYSDETYLTVGAVNDIFAHNPHLEIQILFWKVWRASGYQVVASQIKDPGYAPYEAFSLSNYPTLYRYVGPSDEAITYVESDPIEGVNVFDDAGVYFKANLDSQSYQISQQASLTYLGQPHTTLISIPRSFGIYNLMSYEGTYIDSVEDHYGSVRVFSNAYQVADPATYKDYEIRVIRTSNESISDILSLTVNGVDALDLVYNTSQVIANINLDGTNQNLIEASYQTHNISDLYYMLKHIEVYHFETSVKVHSSYYRIDYGYVATEGEFNNLEGSWGYGSFDILFEPLEDFESGHYILRTTLLSGQTYDIEFVKLASSQKEVTSIMFNNQVIVPESNIVFSYIDYGLYYDPLVDSTYIVDFSNLFEISDISYKDVSAHLPNYLDSLTISHFSIIKQVDLHISQLADLRYQYDIVYIIEAEDLSVSSFTHRLIESQIDLSPTKIYKNGGELENLTHIDISYSQAPTIRLAYDLSKIYISSQEAIIFETNFTPLYTGEQTFEDIDYFIDFKDNIGYEIDFNENISKGEYTFEMTYQHQVPLWGSILSWDLSFDQVTINKVRNNESKIEDILFASDTIFSGFDTIMDIEEITTTAYESYMNYPSTRKINVLPSTGINYHIYENHHAYYIIGQVQKTSLALYEPIFYISDYAQIKKVVNHDHSGPSYQSDDLASDFSPISEGFNFVQYRVYAEDHTDLNPNFTDFYVALQDVTNNIRFDLSINNQSTKDILSLHVNIDICLNDSVCDFSTQVYKMGVFSTYDALSNKFTHTQFQTTMHGTYKINVNLNKGLTYQIILQEAQIDGSSFYLEDSILPRKYYITILITDKIEENAWGYSKYIDQND